MFPNRASSRILIELNVGTTLVYIASNAFTKYRTATGATLDSSTGLLRITSAQYAKLSSLFFNINGVSFAPFFLMTAADFAFRYRMSSHPMLKSGLVR